MPAISSHETVFHVTASDAEPLNLRLEAGTDVRIEVQGSCTCRGSSPARPGSYTDTDFGRR